MNDILIILIVLPIFTAFLIPLMDQWDKEKRKFLVISSNIIEISLLIIFVFNNIDKIKQGTFYLQYNLGEWLPPLGVIIKIDMLSLFFLILTNLLMVLLLFYSIGYIGDHEGKYYVLIFIIWGAMQGVLLTGDIFNLYVMLELILITSAPLIAFKRNREGTEAAIKYMFYGVIGGLLIFIAIILLYYTLGTLNYNEISKNFGSISNSIQSIIVVLFLSGIFIKIGIFPLHFWVAKVQSASPTPISALISGVLINIYIYDYIRFFWDVFGFEVLKNLKLDMIIIHIAILSGLIGIILALYEKDLKKMLAYSTIGHLGIIIATLTINTKSALIAGLFYVLGHSVMKISLFTTSGYLIQHTPTNYLEDFKGVAYKDKIIFAGFIIGAGGMVGFPPMIGFISRWFTIKSFLQSGYYIPPLIIIFGTLFAVVYYFRFIVNGFKKTHLEESFDFKLILSVLYRERIVRDISIVFVILVILLGLFFNVLYIPIVKVVESILSPVLYNFIL